MEPLARPPVILDVGTGSFKLGVAGQVQPSHIDQTIVATPPHVSNASDCLNDLQYIVGKEALRWPRYEMHRPLKDGLVSDFDALEKLWATAFYRYLRVFPEDQGVILTEPPLTSPEDRENTAEIMFETFGVPGLHIGVQAILALYSSASLSSQYAGAKRRFSDGNSVDNVLTPETLTGVVIESGEGCTHCIPVVEGFVIGSAIRSLPRGGSQVTAHLESMLRTDTGAKGSHIPPHRMQEVAQKIKEASCYVCADAMVESKKYAAAGTAHKKYARSLEFASSKRDTTFTVSIDTARFMAPEVLFNPAACAATLTGPPSSSSAVGLASMVDEAVQACPIDTRRALYANLLLSGGNTMFDNFDKRMQRDVQSLVDKRYACIDSSAVGGSRGRRAPQVRVRRHPEQRYAVWAGASVLGSSSMFHQVVVTRDAYREHGRQLVRCNPVFGDLF